MYYLQKKSNISAKKKETNKRNAKRAFGKRVSHSKRKGSTKVTEEIEENRNRK